MDSFAHYLIAMSGAGGSMELAPTVRPLWMEDCRSPLSRMYRLITEALEVAVHVCAVDHYSHGIAKVSIEKLVHTYTHSLCTQTLRSFEMAYQQLDCKLGGGGGKCYTRTQRNRLWLSRLSLFI